MRAEERPIARPLLALLTLLSVSIFSGVSRPVLAVEGDSAEEERAYLYRFRVRPSDRYATSGPLPHTDAADHGDGHVELSDADHRHR